MNDRRPAQGRLLWWAMPRKVASAAGEWKTADTDTVSEMIQAADDLQRRLGCLWLSLIGPEADVHTNPLNDVLLGGSAVRVSACVRR